MIGWLVRLWVMNELDHKLKDAVTRFEQQWKTGYEEATLNYLKKEGEELKGLFVRKWFFSTAFDWSPENVRKIIDLNNGVYELLRKAYDRMVYLKADFDARIACGDEAYENYSIVTRFWYEAPDQTTPDLTLLWFKLGVYTDWQPEFSCGADKDVKPFDDVMLDEISWSKPPFDNAALAGVHIHYFLYSLIHDNDTYSIHDLLQMRVEDFRYQIKVKFKGM